MKTFGTLVYLKIYRILTEHHMNTLLDSQGRQKVEVYHRLNRTVLSLTPSDIVEIKNRG